MHLTTITSLYLQIGTIAFVCAAGWWINGRSLRVATKSSDFFLKANLLILIGAALPFFRAQYPNIAFNLGTSWTALIAIAMFTNGISALAQAPQPKTWIQAILIAVGIGSTLIASSMNLQAPHRNLVFCICELWLAISALSTSSTAAKVLSAKKFFTFFITSPFLLLVFTLLVRLLATLDGLISNPAENPVHVRQELILWCFAFTTLLTNVSLAFLTSGVLVKQVNQLAESDGLTKCLNRRGIEERLRVEFDKFLLTSNRVAVVSVDLDGCTEINEKYGFAMGDLAIQRIAKIFKSNLRENDSIGRFTADSFMIVLPNTSQEEAYHIANKMRREVEASPLGPPEDSVPLSATFGIALLAKGSESCDRIMRLANDARLRGKELGRNRIEMSPVV